MSPSSRLLSRAWIVVLVLSLGFLGWVNAQRAQRVIEVTNTDREAVIDSHSPTGYADGKRWLIVPEHNNRSYQWIAETQQMLAQGQWRLRHIDYENAPAGRAVDSASLYHDWLALLAKIDHALSGRPIGLAVEHVALYADPLLQALALIGLTLYVARRSGGLTASLACVAWTFLFPFSAAFLPGVPEQFGLSLILAAASVLPLVASLSHPAPQIPTTASQKQKKDFVIAGVFGGMGLWLSAEVEIPVILSLVVGAAVAGLFALKRTQNATPTAVALPPWKHWALAGAIASWLGYLIEYFPGHLGWHFETNCPLYGLAWLGLGGVLDWVSSGAITRRAFARPSDGVTLALSLVAILALPVTWLATKASGPFAADWLASRLTFLPNGSVAQSTGAWMRRDGFTAPVFAVVVAIAILIAALANLFRRAETLSRRQALAVALLPALTAAILAGGHLRDWNVVGALLVPVIIAMASDVSSWQIRISLAPVAVAAVVGLIALLPLGKKDGAYVFTRFEVEGLLERALAHWVADHANAPGATVLLPPDRTPSWCFHGGLRGLGTANRENREGLAATIRIVSATTAEEAQNRLAERGVNYLVLPSWDTDLDEFVRWSLPNPDDAFLSALHHWAIPPWLRPIPYPMPKVPGFEDHTVTLFAVTEESNRATSLSRLAEYFIETQQLPLAASAAQTLQKFPTDLGALVALAEVRKAQNDTEGFNKLVVTLVSGVGGGLDRTLAWDRKISLAVVFAQANRNDLARDQIRACLKTINEARIRSLTTAALFRLQVMAKAFDAPFPKPEWNDLARRLLPAELRGRLPQ